MEYVLNCQKNILIMKYEMWITINEFLSYPIKVEDESDEPQKKKGRYTRTAIEEDSDESSSEEEY